LDDARINPEQVDPGQDDPGHDDSGGVCGVNTGAAGANVKCATEWPDTDPTGAVIGGASIKAVNVATNVPYTAQSDGAGIYVLQELLPGPTR